MLFVGLSITSNGQLPEEFFQESIGTFNGPAGITFDERGYGYVWEKGGTIWKIDTNDVLLPTPFLDLSEEVAEWRDHGFLGFTLDPDFLFNGYVYCLYTVDRHHLFNFNTPQYSVDSTIINQATIARVTRFQADAANNFVEAPYGSRKVLIGETIENGIPIPNNFHGIGSLAFGNDGSLLVSTGDGGSKLNPQFAGDFHITQAIAEGIISSEQAIGAYRAQSVDGYNGKILRIDSDTGEGLADNPWYDATRPRSARSMIWTLGIRNPYRMKVIPGSGSHEIGQSDPGVIVFGDVGEGKWEEINFIDQPGLNCGWPVYEGFNRNWHWQQRDEFNLLAPNPLFGQNGCDQEYYKFQDLLAPANPFEIYEWKNPCNENEDIESTTPRFHHHFPVIEYSNKMWNLPARARIGEFAGDGTLEMKEIINSDTPVRGENFAGFSAMAGFYYENGNLPDTYNNSFWIADYSGWIKVMKLDDAFQLIRVDSFARFEENIVDLAFNQNNQSIYFPDLESGNVYKIAYGINPPPVPVVSTDTIWGISPLLVNFDASNSYHPRNLPFESNWDFGDGNTSDQLNPSHTFISENNASETFITLLELTDSIGETATKKIIVSVNNSPPVAEINSIQSGDTYPIGAVTSLKLAATVSDVENSDEELTYQWQTFLHHNAHFHPEPIDTHRIAYSLISPFGCDGDVYYFRIRLKVTDPEGLSASDEVIVRPACDLTGLDIQPQAEAEEASILVSWELPVLDSLASITIQRLTVRIEDWDIGEIAMNGAGSYQFMDTQPVIGQNTFRLRLNYLDGSYDYSKIVNQSFPTDQPFLVFPNPAKDKLTVQLQDVAGKDIDWRILSLSGQEMRNGTFVTPTEDFLEEEIDITDFQNGQYLLEVKIGDRVFIEELLFLR